MKKLLLYITLFYGFLAYAQAPGMLLNNPLYSGIRLNDMVYDSNTDRIYAITQSSDPNNSNSLVVINPHDITVEADFPYEDEPTAMAISDNGQYLYIGFTESSTISRFDIASQNFIDFELGVDEDNNNYRTQDIEVVPGDAETIAVVRFVYDSGIDYGGIGIYENGTLKPYETGEYSVRSDIIRFKDQNTLIGYNGNSSNCPLAIYTIDDSGITVESEHNNIPPALISTYEIDFCIANDKLFFNNSKVVDLLPSPTISGTFQQISNSKMLFDKVNNLVCIAGDMFEFYATQGHLYKAMIKRVNPDTNQTVDTFCIEIYSYGVNKIISCGSDTYALITINENLKNNLTIVQSDAFLSTKVFKEASPITIYPNPATDIIKIQSNQNLINKAEIYNIEGKMIAQTTKTETINIEDLSSGFYLIKLTDENNNTYTNKFVKN